MKKTIQTLSLGFIITLSTCAGRDFIPLYEDTKNQTPTALLIAPIQIDLVYHNEKQTNLTPPYKPLVNYRLLPGKHLLGFRYQDVHLDEDGNQEIITSKVVLIRFIAQAGEIYHIDFDKPDNYFAARELEEKFQITLSQNNQLITSSTPAPEKIENDSFFSGEAFSPETAALFENSTHENNRAPARDEDTMVHLKFWWINASQKERDIFIHWINEDLQQTREQNHFDE